MSGSPQGSGGGADASVRKLAVRFRDLDGLSRQLEGAIRKALILVPDRNPSPAGTPVELTLSLPECHRLIRAEARVERVIEAAGDRPPGMLLRFAESAAGLPGMLEQFLHGCKGVRCRQLEQSLGSLPECDLSPDGRASHVVVRSREDPDGARPGGFEPARSDAPPRADSAVIAIPVARIKPVERRTRSSGSFPKVDPAMLDPAKRNTLVGMQAAPGRAAFSPTMPRPPGSDIAPEQARQQQKKPAKKRRPSLLNLPIFGRKSKNEEEEKKKPASSGPRLSGGMNEKAQSILHQARGLIANGDTGKAISLLKMALAFDPGNEEAQMLLDQSVAAYKPKFGS